MIASWYSDAADLVGSGWFRAAILPLFALGLEILAKALVIPRAARRSRISILEGGVTLAITALVAVPLFLASQAAGDPSPPTEPDAFKEAMGRAVVALLVSVFLLLIALAYDQAVGLQNREQAKVTLGTFIKGALVPIVIGWMSLALVCLIVPES